MKRWIIAVRIALGAILLSIGSVFFYSGAWIYLSGRGTRPAGLEYLMMGFGGSMLIVGIVLVLELVPYPWASKVRKWIIAVSTLVFDIILLYIGSLILYGGASIYLSGSRYAQFTGSLSMIIGGSIIIVGTLIALRLVIFFRRQRGV